MNFPSVPTDSFYKFFFISGIFIFFYSNIYLQTKADDFKSKTSEYQKKLIEFSFKDDQSFDRLKKVSADRDNILNALIKSTEAYNNAITSVGIAEKKINAIIKSGNKISPRQYDSLKRYGNSMLAQNDKRLSVLEDSINSLTQKYKEDSASADAANNEIREQAKLLKLNEDDLDYFKEMAIQARRDVNNFTTLAYLLVLVGSAGWFYFQNIQDQLLLNQRDQIFKKCQSCGVRLKYEKHLNKESIYCSHCYNGEGFTDPDISLKGMKLAIKVRMKEQKIDWLNIKLHLAKIKKLSRWNNDFKW
jgi:hypothetical protein